MTKSSWEKAQVDSDRMPVLYSCGKQNSASSTLSAMILPLLLVVGVSCGVAEDFYLDETLNCNSCNGETQPYSLERSCQCDEKCAISGDCCVDSPHFRSGRLSACVRAGDWNTGSYFANYYYMVNTCPTSWEGDNNTRDSCKNYRETIKREPILGHPVTSNATNITYANYHCAKCNGDLHMKSMVRWKLAVTCDVNLQLPVPHVDTILQQASIKMERFVAKFPNASYRSCQLYVWRPNQLLRRCEPNVVQTCPSRWTNATVRAQCEAYTSIVYRRRSKPYRNPHCAICNKIPVKEIGCRGEELKPEEHFPIIFDFSDGTDNRVGHSRICPSEDEAYDPLAKKCRHILWVMAGQENASNCSRFVLEPGEFSLNEDLSARDLLSGKVFPTGSFSVTDDGRLLVCAEYILVRDKFGDGVMRYVSLLGLGLSVVCLALHLGAFLVSPSLRNLSGKNLASFCAALLVAYITFIAAEFLEVGGAACTLAAVVLYYTLMASFSWLLLMAFDVWRTLRLSTVHLRVVSRESRHHVFLTYAVLAWLLLPGSIVCASLTVEFLLDETALIRPRFGSYNCWFGARWALAMFFAVPVGVIMALNLMFYISSAHMICSTTVSKSNKSSSTRRDHRLFARLALLMGLTWITGFIADYLNLTAMWYIYVALNAFQGLFIFGAFTMTQKICDRIRTQVSGDSKTNSTTKETSSKKRKKTFMSLQTDCTY
ncbi:uncharacterized protein [Periplaneta americana]|uniref:uncharacterized protein n=1 Tax=Periplaneta americana TaxID=6978 RepID=UPI0037E7CBE6